MMGEEWGKHLLQEACGGKADLAELGTSMGDVPRSLAMVPEGWEDAALSDLVKLKRGYDLPAQDRALSGDIQVIGGGGPNGFHNVAKAPAPGIVIGRSGAGIGNAWWSDKPFWPLNTGLYVTDFQTNDPRFCFLLLDWIDFRSHNTGGAQPSLNRNFIYPIRILLPPLHEQRKIAEILRTWDQAIEKTEALLVAARTRKRGLMQILLTGKRRFSEFEGQVWREVRLGEVASVDRHSLGSKTAPDFTFDYISLSNVEPGRIVGPLKQVIFEKAPSRARRIVELGDLLISTVRPNLLGFARVTEEYQNCIASTGFAVVTPKPEADASYLLHYLFSHHMKSQFHSLVVGSNYPAINSSDVLKLKVRLPSVDEQCKVGAVLNGCDEEVTALIGQIENLCTQKKALMQRLLTGEWRVKVEDPVV